MDFRLTEQQRRFFDRPGAFLTGRRGGRRLATELFVVATAANQHEAELALEDLRTKGIAALTEDGRRVDPGGRRRFAVVKFDEEKRG